MKIYIASDHAGYLLKNELALFLVQKGFEVFDCGPDTYNPTDDYPDFISVAARSVASDAESWGIVIGRNGQGEAILANRFPHIRCAVFYGGSKHVLTLSREHDNANMLSLGAGFITQSEAKIALELWLHTKFSGDERHVRRLSKIDEITEHI